MIDTYDNIKITDFGISTMYDNQHGPYLFPALKSEDQIIIVSQKF